MPDPMNWIEWCRQHCSFAEETMTELVGANGDWTPSAPDQAFAWALYVEMRTRISTQRLHFLSGDEATALDSLFKLFQIVRDVEKKCGLKAVVVASLTNVVLNGKIRPLTALWHKRKVDGKLNPEDLRHVFRRRLLELQDILRDFQRLLLQIACRDVADGTVQERKFAETYHSIPLGDSITFDTLLGLSGTKHDNDANAIIEAESKEITNRRVAVGQESPPDPEDDPNTIRNLTGLAISGGGIRSATFALGVLQGLAQYGIVKQIDVVSTVSGGGYLGSFLSTFLNTDSAECGPQADREPFKPGIAKDSKAIRSLRNHSRYIQPSSFGRWLISVGQAAYGIVSNLIILSLWVFLATLLTEYTIKPDLQTYHGYVYSTPTVRLPASAWTLWNLSKLGLVVSCGLFFLLPLAQRFNRIFGRSQSKVSYWEWTTAFSFVVTAAMIAIDLLPNAHYAFMLMMRWIGETLHTSNTGAQGWSLTATFVAAGNTIGLLVARGKWIKKLAESFPLLGKLVFVLLWLCGPVLFAYAYFELCRVYVASPHAEFDFMGKQIPPACLLSMLALGSFAYSFMCNVNFTSLHRFYRNRLAETYLLKHVPNSEPQPRDGLRLLSEMRKDEKSTAPYHLLNAALNLPSSEVDELRGRDCDFFLFSKHYSGSPVVGYSQTTNWEKADSHLDLGTAMAISGAAAAPQMGMGSIRGASFLMTLLNVRLGYWQRRPYNGEWFVTLRKLLGGPGPWYLGCEALNWMNKDDKYLNLTDGGHIENLAIYELLRRRCRFIIAIDGEQDPILAFPSLRKLQRLAKVDLGVEIDISVDRINWNRPPVDPNADDGERQVEDKSAEKKKPIREDLPYSRGHFAIGKITYPGSTQETPITGWLVYIKLSVTGNEADYVAEYRRIHPDFPHQSTADQLFEEDQFEAYRCLGQHITEDLFSDELSFESAGAEDDGEEQNEAPKPGKDENGEWQIESWIQALANALYEG